MATKNRNVFIDHYLFAFVATIIIMALTVYFGGIRALIPVITLAVIEVTFSFDNAVLNSQVLSTMNKFWQTMFLTVGIAIAVFGVRLFLPLLLVSATSGGSLGNVLDMALHKPELYAEQLHVGYPLIAAFGGVFLLMIGVKFFVEEKDILWLRAIEHPLSKTKHPWVITFFAATLAILAIPFLSDTGATRAVIAGLLGAITFTAISLASSAMTSHGKGARGSWVQFLYLELLDASFSFDGVVAAFAITKDVLLIVAGLGIGALYVRSITVHLLQRKTLATYRYLVHGAHYAIGVLAIVLIVSIKHEIPDIITGLTGLLLIGLAFESSRRHNNRSVKIGV